MRQNSRWVITVNQIAVTVVVFVVVAFLTIAAVTARNVRTSPSAGVTGESLDRASIAARNESRAALVQVIAGFGLLSLWIISGAVMIGKARGDHILVLGRSSVAPADDTVIP
jgi:hypothetical protein